MSQKRDNGSRVSLSDVGKSQKRFGSAVIPGKLPGRRQINDAAVLRSLHDFAIPGHQKRQREGNGVDHGSGDFAGNDVDPVFARQQIDILNRALQCGIFLKRQVRALIAGYVDKTQDRASRIKNANGKAVTVYRFAYFQPYV